MRHVSVWVSLVLLTLSVGCTRAQRSKVPPLKSEARSESRAEWGEAKEDLVEIILVFLGHDGKGAAPLFPLRIDQYHGGLIGFIGYIKVVEILFHDILP